MTRLVLLSDLHFGMHRTTLTAPLLVAVNDARPDLVVIAGDMTHRGRTSQFAQAASFLTAISAPWIAVPGNHDVPLYNLLARLRRPYRNWQRWISADLAPRRDAGTVRVIGANSVDPMVWQRGKIGPTTIRRITGALSDELTNLIVLHHPLEQLPQVDKALMQGAPAALAAFQDAGAQIAITGHLHIWQADAFAGRPLLQIQAGTALCDRLGDGQNEFAILDLDGDDLTLTRHISPMTGPPEFTRTVIEQFSRAGGIWRRLQLIDSSGG